MSADEAIATCEENLRHCMVELMIMNLFLVAQGG